MQAVKVGWTSPISIGSPHRTDVFCQRKNISKNVAYRFALIDSHACWCDKFAPMTRRRSSHQHIELHLHRFSTTTFNDDSHWVRYVSSLVYLQPNDVVYFIDNSRSALRTCSQLLRGKAFSCFWKSKILSNGTSGRIGPKIFPLSSFLHLLIGIENR